MIFSHIRRLSLLVFLASGSQLFGEVMLVPRGIGPGDQYRLAFVTSAVRDATSTDINVYNEFVQSVADAAPVVGSWGLEWRVIGSTEAVDARDNTETNPLTDETVPIYRVDGSRYAVGYAQLWGDGNNELNITEHGELLSFGDMFSNDFDGLLEPVFTGSRADGRGIRPLGVSPASNIGFSILDGDFGFDFGAVGITRELPFYAMSEVITAVPEPESSSIAWLLAAFLLLYRPPRRRAL